MFRLSCLLVLLALSCSLYGQDRQPNSKNGLAVKGYDVVSYFDGVAQKGSEEYSVEVNDLVYRFSSVANLEKFEQEPTNYTPQYGGWCAYAAATNGEKVDINPKTYEIRDGKLYLFYNKLFTNTLKLWLGENPEELVLKADEMWMIGLK